MKDIYCSYYTHSKDIVNYMVNELHLRDGDSVLEPSAGDGVFIEAILKSGRNMNIHGFDIDPSAITILHDKFSSEPCVTIENRDTLLFGDDDFSGEARLSLNEVFRFSKIIGNPPYGAWQSIERRRALQKLYSGFYVKETYSLFLLKCVSLLKDKGKLVFIIPDTFLYLSRHKSLRKYLLTHTNIKRVLIFPSKFFPNVSFGHANLSIITLERENSLDACLHNEVEIVSGFSSTEEFRSIESKENSKEGLIRNILRQNDILNSKDYSFSIVQRKDVFVNISTSLGEYADIVTGLYTGDNKLYIQAKNYDIKNSKGYSVVDMATVVENIQMDGHDTETAVYVPYIKNIPAKGYFLEETEWYVRWDKQAIFHYKNDKKARFQNSSFYFKKGIGIPMVKSSKIRGVLMEDRVFDQAVVGIFPKDNNLLLYMLAFCNSSVFNQLIHFVNPSANNSANYIKKVPFIIPSEEQLNQINVLVLRLKETKEIKDNNTVKDIENTLNEIIHTIYKDYL